MALFSAEPGMHSRVTARWLWCPMMLLAGRFQYRRTLMRPGTAG
jgi:hypothetical protein